MVPTTNVPIQDSDQTYVTSDAAWARYWEIYVWIQVAASLVVIVWFTVGGFRDVREMTRRLATMSRDEKDDGMVRAEDAAPVDGPLAEVFE